MQSTREVASGVLNLGSTCYMNAVLQALAHAPELCSAIECESHFKSCPIAKSNTQRRLLKAKAKLKKAKLENKMEPKLEDSAIVAKAVAVKMEEKTNTGSKRRKTNGSSSNRRNKNNNKHNEDDDEDEFCLLCEIEKHLIRVHNSGSLDSLSLQKENNSTSRISSTSITDGNHSNSNSSSSSNNGGPVAPSDFVHGFTTHVAPWFKLGVQEDSHEFLRLLIDAMQKSCIHSREKIKTENNNDNQIINGDIDNKSTSTSINGDNDNDKHNKKTRIRKEVKTEKTKKTTKGASQQHDGDEYAFRLFRGTVESIVKCSKCKSISSTIDPIEDIGLDVTKSSPSSSSSFSTTRSSRGNISPSPSSLSNVQGALEKFITMEKLDSGYKCESCGKVGQATKQSRLASIPPILTLHLKRFRYGSDGGKSFAQTAAPSRRRNTELASLLGNGDIGTSGSAKIEGHIEFKMIFDIRPYMTTEKQKEVGKSMLCRLFAVVVHAGKNSHSGHYICYVRNIAKNEWWKMDDAKVTRVTPTEVIAAEAYMLFYRVMDHPVSVELRNREKAMKEAMAEKIAKEKVELEAMKMKMKEEEKTATDSTCVDANINKNGHNREHEEKIVENEISLTNKRKREEPEFKSGDDWARAVTNLPDSWIPFIRRIQDVLSDQLNFKAEYFRVLQDEVKAGGKLGDGPSVGIAADDIQGGISGLRKALKDMLKTILPEEKELLEQLLSSVKVEDVGIKVETRNGEQNQSEHKEDDGDSSTKERNSTILPIYSNDTML